MLKASARILYKSSQVGNSYVGGILKKADSGGIEKYDSQKYFWSSSSGFDLLGEIEVADY